MKKIFEDNFQLESLYPPEARKVEIGKMLEILKRGKSVQLVGLPGTGRSAVLTLLAYNKEIRKFHLGEDENKYLFVHMDFSEVRRRSLGDVMKMMFLALADSLRDSHRMNQYEKVNDLMKNAIALGDELVITEELKHSLEQLAIEELHTVFLFDMFEDYVGQVDDLFFANLRILRVRVKYYFGVVFSANKPIESLLDAEITRDFLEYIEENPVYISQFDEVAFRFRLDFLYKLTGKSLSSSVENEVIKLSGGNLKIARYACETLLSEAKLPNNMQDFLIDRRSVVRVLEDIWNSLSPEEQSQLLNIEKTENISEYLTKSGLIIDKNISIPLLREYIRSVPVQSEGEKIIYDSDKDIILRGEMELSDDLTSLEFLLLKYFVTNPDIIISRDQIINIVWGDNKSVIGVTDQALDQLISRLRKKIESNPSDPIHIVTVKGRGFKFIQ